MALLIINDPPFKPWLDLFSELAPNMRVLTQDDEYDPEDIEYAFVWEPEPGTLGGLPALKAVFSVGTGANGILRDKSLANSVPIFRTIGTDAPDLMAEYVVTAAFFLHRRWGHLLVLQGEPNWEGVFEQPLARNTRVSVLGLGALGQAVASRLAVAGFNVTGWARSKHILDGIETSFGSEGLRSCIETSQILVNVLPLTNETNGILSRKAFDRMPPGASLISVGRGEHIVEEDLLNALERGHLEYAILDVFREEPLPKSHPFWKHDKILVTQHSAAVSSRRARVERVLHNISLIQSGKPPPLEVDRTRGY